MRHRLAARRITAAFLMAAMILPAAACSSAKTTKIATGTAANGSSQKMSDMDMGDMAGIPTAPALAEAAPTSTGLAASYSGYIYLPAAASLAANTPAAFDFHITGPNDHAVTRYQPYESKLVTFYLVRSDLTGFQQLDPTMRQDGTWSVGLPALPAGSYRTYVTFGAPDSSEGTPLVYSLSAPLSVTGSGANAAAALPAPASSVTVDGYTLKLSGALKAGTTTQLALEVTSGGKPVVYFDRYLDGYAHLTGFREGDGAFAHLLATGRAGGAGGSGALTTRALFPESGTWRLFVQFETGGKLHEAAFTVAVS
ncbi:MAG TPA: hypothetical protein VFU65_14985 [Actinocrinis sp.]|nr:hypothetical protein [Actinocrinis sp.]